MKDENINLQLNIPMNQKLNRIVDYIDENYSDLSIDDFIELLSSSNKIKNLLDDCLDNDNDVYKFVQETKNNNLKNLFEAYIYITGLEKAKKMDVSDNFEISKTDSTYDNYDSANIYFDSLKFPVLTREEEQDLATRMKNGDMVARKRLIECNLKLVVYIALQIARKKGNVIPLMDMISEGNVGLVHAIDRFDASYGMRISTYVTSHIVTKITNAIDKQSKNIERPRHYDVAYKKYKQVQVLMSQILGRDATKMEIAKLLNISVAELENFENLQATVISMYTPIGESEETELYEIIPDNSLPPVHKNIDDKYLEDEMMRILGTLPNREADIIYDLFYEKMSFDEIGKRHNLTRERVRQIVIKVLKLLRNRKDVQNLLPYITDKEINYKNDSEFTINEDFSIRAFSKKDRTNNKSHQLSFGKFYDRMKKVCIELKNNKYSYEDLAINNDKKKTIK